VSSAPPSDLYQGKLLKNGLWFAAIISAVEGENIMVLDNEAMIALGFLAATVVVTVGLVIFLIGRMKR
jgi:hypothetical protein